MEDVKKVVDVGLQGQNGHLNVVLSPCIHSPKTGKLRKCTMYHCTCRLLLKSSHLYEILTEWLQNSNVLLKKKHLHIFRLHSFQISNFLRVSKPTCLRNFPELSGLRTWAYRFKPCVLGRECCTKYMYIYIHIHVCVVYTHI